MSAASSGVYPSLYARVARNGDVSCTATLRPLGIVRWVQRADGSVAWLFAAVGTPETGERTTQRAAVQSLRDIANKRAQHPLPLGDDERPLADRAAERIARARERSAQPQLPDVNDDDDSATTAPAPVRLPPTTRVSWGDKPTDVADLTSAIQRAFDRHKDAK